MGKYFAIIILIFIPHLEISAQTTDEEYFNYMAMAIYNQSFQFYNDANMPIPVRFEKYLRDNIRSSYIHMRLIYDASMDRDIEDQYNGLACLSGNNIGNRIFNISFSAMGYLPSISSEVEHFATDLPGNYYIYTDRMDVIPYKKAGFSAKGLITILDKLQLGYQLEKSFIAARLPAEETAIYIYQAGSDTWQLQANENITSKGFYKHHFYLNLTNIDLSLFRNFKGFFQDLKKYPTYAGFSSLSGSVLDRVQLFNKLTISGSKVEIYNSLFVTPIKLIPFISIDYFGDFDVLFISSYINFWIGSIANIWAKPSFMTQAPYFESIEGMVDFYPLVVWLMQNSTSDEKVSMKQIRSFWEGGINDLIKNKGSNKKPGFMAQLGPAVKYTYSNPMFIVPGESIENSLSIYGICAVAMRLRSILFSMSFAVGINRSVALTNMLYEHYEETNPFFVTGNFSFSFLF